MDDVSVLPIRTTDTCRVGEVTAPNMTSGSADICDMRFTAWPAFVNLSVGCG